MVKKIRELFGHKRLIFDLVLKDLKVKYRRALGGFAWTFINPMAMTVIFYVLFKLIFKIDIKNYPLFLLCGLFPWAFLQTSLSESNTSVIANANLIKKAYFPREVLPLSVILTHLVNFIASLIILFITALFFKVSLIRIILWLPFILAVQLLLIMGLSLITSSLNACYRDTQFVVNLILLVWFYATPIIYPVQMAKKALPSYILKVYMLNPMVGIITAYRDLFLYSVAPDPLVLGASFTISLVVFISGLFIFNHFEKILVDIL